MYIVDIRFSHGAEPLLTMRVAYTHIVSIGSAAYQKLLRWLLSSHNSQKLSPYTPNRLQMTMYKGIDDGV